MAYLNSSNEQYWIALLGHPKLRWPARYAPDNERRPRTERRFCSLCGVLHARWTMDATVLCRVCRPEREPEPTRMALALQSVKRQRRRAA
jgi:hypothetical protein